MWLKCLPAGGITVRDIVENLPNGDFRRVVIKPNWVLHASHPEFPIEVLVTDSALIGKVLDACFQKYSSLETLIVGDVPLQSCDFSQLQKQAGIDILAAECRSKYGDKVRFLDLRRERYKVENGFMVLDNSEVGDPSGYCEVCLDAESHLEEISHRSDTFRVSDYDPKETTSVHRKGKHRYLVARSILEADLVINMPKLKTHQKSGITGALKNLVGINGSKAYLVHHQLGKPSTGGDEFPEDVSLLIVFQTRLRSLLQKRLRYLFSTFRFFWMLIKKIRGIHTVATRDVLRSRKMYTASGSWHGNDSVWRMVYDLNMVLLYGRAEGGPLECTPQRQIISIMDADIAGEGNGPLQALPVELGVILISPNPFLVDFAAAKIMGFDWNKIRLLANYKHFLRPDLVAFDPTKFSVEWMSAITSSNGIDALPVIKHFVPPPGWQGHLELPLT